MRTRALIPILALLALPSIAMAQASGAIDEVKSIRFRDENGWTMYPATLNNQVVGFLARQTEGTAAPNGFKVLWYARNDDSTYTMHGWKGDAVAAAAHVNTMFGETVFAHVALAPDACGAANTGTLVPMKNGLALNDPYQAVAATATPDEMEAYVAAGAQGATALSANWITTVAAGTCTASQTQLYLNQSVPTAEKFMFGEVIDNPNCKAFCIPGWIDQDFTTTTWDPTGFPCVGGGCKYGGNTSTRTRTCWERADCSLTSCTWGTPTTGRTSRICPGACVPPPPPC